MTKKKVSKKNGAASVKDLMRASAEYNPRMITNSRLNGLRNSYDAFGDLSGVVLNIRSNTMVSGHQRIKTLKGRKSRITKEFHEDSCGTVATGWIEYVDNNNKLCRIPYREVDWSDDKVEKAANIAANAHGGEFDKNKLGALIEEIENVDGFDVELTGLDPLTIRSLSLPGAKAERGEGNYEDEDPTTESGESFEEYDEDSFEFEHSCPRCSYKW